MPLFAGLASRRIARNDDIPKDLAQPFEGDHVGDIVVLEVTPIIPKDGPIADDAKINCAANPQVGGYSSQGLF